MYEVLVICGNLFLKCVAQKISIHLPQRVVWVLTPHPSGNSSFVSDFFEDTQHN